jgi:hypothetical protein
VFRHLQDIDRIDVDIETPSQKCGRQAQDPCECLPVFYTSLTKDHGLTPVSQGLILSPLSKIGIISHR